MFTTIRSQLRSLTDNLRLALGFVWNSGPRWTIANIGLLIVQGLLPLFTLYFIKLLVDEVADAIQNPTPAMSLDSITVIMIGMGTVALLGNVCTIAAAWVTKGQSQIVHDYMQKILHAKSIEVDLEYYENSQYYDRLHRAQQEAAFRPNSILHALLQVGQSGISLVAIGGLLAWFHWAVIPVLVLVALPEFFVRLRYANVFYQWERARTERNRKSWYFNWMLTRDTHAKEIRLFGLGPRFLEMYQHVRQVLREELLALEKRRSLASIGAQGVATIGVFGVYFFVAHQTLQGVLSLGDLVMYFQAIQRGAGFLQQFSTNLSGLYEHNLFLTNLDEFLGVRSKILGPVSPHPIPQMSKEGLVFDQVTFQYPEEQRPALDHFSLTIQPGEHIAIVGENGAGKTTLVKLLCRLYDPTQGAIRLEGINIQHFSVDEWRKTVSVTFQDFARYFLTAQENIALNASESQGSERVQEAAMQSGAHTFIQRFPQGYDTILGKWFEGGKELSGGEWQKIALARAFYRASPILVLDEPSSALDAKSEADLFERFHQFAKGRIAILISHRMSTVKMADRIYVLKDGRVAEAGTHQELMQKKGQYSELFESQARNYQE